jgi:hypothetical protein
MASRKFFWLILAMCVLSAAATMVQMLTVYLMSLVELPQVYEHFNSALVEATDIEKVKAACSSLAQWGESERAVRVKLMVHSPLIALATSTVCAVLAAWALVTTRNSKTSV